MHATGCGTRWMRALYRPYTPILQHACMHHALHACVLPPCSVRAIMQGVPPQGIAIDYYGVCTAWLEGRSVLHVCACWLMHPQHAVCGLPAACCVKDCANQGVGPWHACLHAHLDVVCSAHHIQQHAAAHACLWQHLIWLHASSMLSVPACRFLLDDHWPHAHRRGHHAARHACTRCVPQA